jgi:hypothetical protein
LVEKNGAIEMADSMKKSVIKVHRILERDGRPLR